MNKRIAAFFAACAIIVGIGHAETHYKSHVTIGGHAGMSMSMMSFSPSVPQGWLMAPTLGLQANYSEEKLVGLQAELNFVQRGWAEKFEDNPGLNYKRTLSYLEIPVMTHIVFGKPRFKWFFNLGPQVAFMISNSISSNFDYTNPASAGIESTRQYKQMSLAVKNKFDYGICVGTGGEFWLAPRRSLFLEARFYYGLNSIYGSRKIDPFSASRPMSLAFTLGYNFRLK